MAYFCYFISLPLTAQRVLIIILLSCKNAKTPVLVKDEAWKERCDGVTMLSWQKEIQGADANTVATVMTKLSAAVKTDAELSEKINAGADASLGVESQIARAINENVQKSSEVSTDFWEQENTFSRLYCLSVSLLDREDISKARKDDIVNDIRDMQKAEATYALNKKKKIGNNQ